MIDLIKNNMIHFFEKPWWQGLAGITQIIAGILALVTINQARKTIKHSEQMKKDSVAPQWDIVSDNIRVNSYQDKEKYYYADGNIILINSGYGSARNLQVEFIPINQFKPNRVDLLNIEKATKTVPKEATISILLSWNIDEPPYGILKISCFSINGDKHYYEFILRTYINESDFFLSNLAGWEISFPNHEYKKIRNNFIKNNKNKLLTINSKGEKYKDIEQWIRSNFKVESVNLDSLVILEVNPDGSSSCINLSNFIILLANCNFPPTLTDLKKISQYNSWHERFDDWARMGIISK